MLPILNIGPLAIQTPGLAVFVALWLGLTLAEKHSSSRGIDPNHIYNLVAISLVAGILGARLVYAGRYPNAFIESPISLISINPSLLDPAGGVFLALVAAVIYAQRRSMSFWRTLDALTPVASVLAVGLGISHLASGSFFGFETSLPWAIELFGASRHPTQVYEILGALLILILIWPGRKLVQRLQDGGVFLRFTVLYAVLYLLVDAFRADSAVILGGFRLGQITAMFVLVASVWFMGRLPDEDSQSDQIPAIPSQTM
jgi:phosphatidylglycerol:prolipoprotein diacylglycerol transferase